MAIVFPNTVWKILKFLKKVDTRYINLKVKAFLIISRYLEKTVVRKGPRLVVLKSKSECLRRLECWLSHLGVAGLGPGHDNLWNKLGE